MQLTITFDIFQSDEALRRGESVYAEHLVKAVVESLAPLVNDSEANYAARTGNVVGLVRVNAAVVADPIYQHSEKLYGRPVVMTPRP